MSKELVFMKEIITQYHPDFVNSRDMKKAGLAHPEYFHVEFLVEESLAAIGGYKYVDMEGYDFTDYSDSKTTTVNSNTGAVTISSVETKIGALRITAYNPFKQSTDFFFIPKKDVSRVRMPCYGNNSHKQRIVFTYSKKYNDDYGYFEEFRVKNFRSLACANG